MKITAVISDIKVALAEKPFDPLHDISHHYEVWKNCYDIITSGKLKLDKDALYIAAWSHDLETYYANNNNHQNLKEILKRHEVPENQISKIIRIIEEHSFSKKQTIIESEVISDADKLEHVSIYRWEYTLQALMEGYFTKDRVIYYQDLQNKLLENVESGLYFNFSRNKYKILKDNFINYANKKGIYKGGKVSVLHITPKLKDV